MKMLHYGPDVTSPHVVSYELSMRASRDVMYIELGSLFRGSPVPSLVTFQFS
jgi:hypothetical protein